MPATEVDSPSLGIHRHQDPGGGARVRQVRDGYVAGLKWAERGRGGHSSGWSQRLVGQGGEEAPIILAPSGFGQPLCSWAVGGQALR